MFKTLSHTVSSILSVNTKKLDGGKYHTLKMEKLSKGLKLNKRKLLHTEHLKNSISDNGVIAVLILKV